MKGHHDTARKDSIKFKHPKHGEHGHLEEYVSLFSGGDRESYLLHLDNVSAICDKKSYGTLYKGYENEVTNAQDDLCMHELSKPEEGHWSIAAAELATEDQLPHETSSAEAKIPRKRLTPIAQKWLEDQEVLNNKIKNGRAKLDDVMKQVFALHESLLDSPLRKDWTEIVQKVCHSPNWVDEDGKTHAEERGKTWKALEVCQREWLLASCFHKDDAGQQRQYMRYHIICNCDPTRLPPRQFIQRMKQLSDYMRRLPCLKDCEPAPNDYDRENVPFTEQELAQICLNAFPRKTRTLYNAIHKGKRPTSLQELREGIETVQPLLDKKTAAAAPTNDNKPTTGGDKNSGKRRSSGGDKNTRGGKRRNNQNSKLHCERCEELGGFSHNHNTADCKKWLKNKEPNPNFGKRRQQQERARTTNAIAAADATSAIATVVQAAVHQEMKKLKKSSYFHASGHHGKRKRHDDPRSGDSESSGLDSR